MKLIERITTKIVSEEPLIHSQPSTAEYYAIFSGELLKRFPERMQISEVTHFIFDQLKEEKSEDELVKAMTENYTVEEDIAREDVKALIGQLKSAGIISD